MKCKICKRMYSIEGMKIIDGICSKCRNATLGTLIKMKLINPIVFDSPSADNTSSVHIANKGGEDGE